MLKSGEPINFVDEEPKQNIKSRSELIEKLKSPVGGLQRKNPLTPNQCYSPREYVLTIAAKVPVTCLQELFDNAEKIQEWLKEPVGIVVSDDDVMKYFDCSAV
jgi:hypothetical protein